MRDRFLSRVIVLMVLLGASALRAESPDAEPAAPWWLGSKAGITREVLPPWTPVEAAGATVKVWGRTYEFGTLPLPCSVVTKDAEVLAAPIVLRGIADGKELTWTGPGCRTVEAQPDAVRLAGEASSGNLRCEGTVTIEYDGMIRCDLRLLPKTGKVTIQRLTLEMPLLAQHARYLHFWPGRWGSAFNSAALPEDGYRGKFRPFFWLGDERRGLSWFCETDQYFFNAKDTAPIEVERNDGTAVFRVNLVTSPQTVDRPLEYTFGFQATPVKPLKPDVWDYRISHMWSYGIEDRPYTPPGEKPTTELAYLARSGVRTLCFHDSWSHIQSYPATTHGRELKKLVAACHRENVQLLLYFGYQMSNIAPEWTEYGKQCLVMPQNTSGGAGTDPRDKEVAYMVCFRSAWQDFVAAHLEKLFDEYDIDGLYLDGTSEPWACTNQLHGCGYRRADGTIGKTYSIFATRSMMKRIYTIVRKHKPHGQVNVHQSSCMVIPTLAFATSYWDGEHLRKPKRPMGPSEVLPLDAFRCEFMGHNWGVPAELLHSDHRRYASGPLKRPQAIGLALLHDVPVRPLRSKKNLDKMSRLWRAFDAFGRREATWLPYWENDRYVGCGPEGIKTSIYNRPGKGFMAVIVNSGSKDCRAEAAFDLAALKQPGKLVARDVLTGKELPLVEGRVSLPLGPLGFVFFRAEPR